jgi:hypothetical protein
MDIWRVEFQVRREGEQGFAIATTQEEMDEDDWERELEGEGLPRLTIIRKALRWLPRQWMYLTKHWLRVVEPGRDRNRARWPVHPIWQVIQ